MRAPVCPAMPPTLSPINSHSPVCTPARYFDTELSDSERNGEGAAHRSRRTVECREKTVARRVRFLPTETRQFLSDNGVVRVQKIAPCGVAKLCCTFGGRRNIEKEYGGQDTIRGIDRALAGNEFLNIGQHSFHVIKYHRVAVTGVFPEFCARNPRRHVTRSFNISARIACAIHHERGRLN